MPRVHHCFAQHLNEVLPPRKCSGDCKRRHRKCTCKRCTCRKNVTMKRARKLVDYGMAEWVTETKEAVELKKLCPICANQDHLKKSCLFCDRTGFIVTVQWKPIRKTNDIVMVSLGDGEPGKELFRPVVGLMVPKAPTIESEHIERAYVDGFVDEQERINLYGQMNLEFLNSLIVPFIPDPNEGRCLFPFGPDERTFPRVTRR